ncbi:MAG: TrmO family methyltransferase domain-containing protein [Bacteroidales bacterium]
MNLISIGTIKKDNETFKIQINPEFIPALKHVEDFSHIQVLWWAHLTEDPESRSKLKAGKLFKKGPDDPGTFSTRSPERPNPIMISTIKILKVVHDTGIITTPFIDAEPGTPVIDIKPVYPMERVKNCLGPEWCSHWPQWQEEVGEFDWSGEVNF